MSRQIDVERFLSFHTLLGPRAVSDNVRLHIHSHTMDTHTRTDEALNKRSATKNDAAMEIAARIKQRAYTQYVVSPFEIEDCGRLCGEAHKQVRTLHRQIHEAHIKITESARVIENTSNWSVTPSKKNIRRRNIQIIRRKSNQSSAPHLHYQTYKLTASPAATWIAGLGSMICLTCGLEQYLVD